MVILGWSKAVGFFRASLMTSETGCDDVTVTECSFPPTGRVGELWEVRSPLIVQTVHPILVNYRRAWSQIINALTAQH